MSVPGFQGTVNNYRVGMYDRTSGNILQWMNVALQANEGGTVTAPITMENDSMTGFTGSIRMVARDSAGNVLLSVVSPTYSISGKSKSPFW